MTIKQWIFAGILAALSAVPGVSATLGVQATVTQTPGLFNYSYVFSVSGAGAAIDNIFLGSNDLSPLHVVLKVDGSPTANWSWLGNDTPNNYLQFFDTAGGALGNGDALDVTFSSAFASGTMSAVGLDSATGAATNTVTGVNAPSAVPTPEPGSLCLLASGIALVLVGRRYTGKVCR